MDNSQQYVSGSEDEDEVTLLDAMQGRIDGFNQFTDLQYLAHPIHHHRMCRLIHLSAEHSLSTENAVERLIHVLATHVEWLENVLMHGLRSGNLRVHHSNRSILPRSRSLSPTRLPLPSTRQRDSPVPHLQNGPTRMVSNLHGHSIVSPSLTESDSQATEIDGVFYPKEVIRNAT
ncbi:hypothetical protein L208DRAFT_1411692 [Tricholoma matsutake]|nr:hypothetical protein L208DRAFT_1411692 [Tricholoma matsutake 945]